MDWVEKQFAFNVTTGGTPLPSSIPNLGCSSSKECDMGGLTPLLSVLSTPKVDMLGGVEDWSSFEGYLHSESEPIVPVPTINAIVGGCEKSSSTLDYPLVPMEVDQGSSGITLEATSSDSRSAAVSGPVTHVADNDKRALDARWTEEELSMSNAQLKQYLKTASYSEEDVRELKAARRRKKNRGYQETARNKRKQKYKSLEVQRQTVGETNAQLLRELYALRKENDALKQRELALLKYVQESGKIPQTVLKKISHA